MRISSENLDETIKINKTIKDEIQQRMEYVNNHLKNVRIYSEKQAFQILKDYNLIQVPVPDTDWGGAIYTLPNGKKIPVINTAQPRLYQYFTCWHEIYHLIDDPTNEMKHEITTGFDLQERKADNFASRMLISDDVYRYYHQQENEQFVDRIAYCMDTFKAPYKAILIHLYDLAQEFSNEQLSQQIKENFDLKITQEDWANIFVRLSLDDSLVKPSFIIDFGKLKELIEDHSTGYNDVVLYTENKFKLSELEEKFMQVKEAESGKFSRT